MERTIGAFTRRLALAIVFSMLLSTVAWAQKAHKSDGEEGDAEKAKFLEEIGKMVNQSSEGLTVYKLSDGTQALYLQERFQVISLAKKNADGTVTAECVTTQKDAETFLKEEGKLKEGDKREPQKKEAAKKPAPALEVK